MDFRERDGAAIALPRLQQCRCRTPILLAPNAHGFDVRVCVTMVASVSARRVSVEALIEEAFAGDVVIHAENRRRTVIFVQLLELPLGNPGPAQESPHRALV